MKIKYFKSKIRTNRFNINQKVFVLEEFWNHLHISYKFRWKWRRVTWVIDKHNTQWGWNKCIWDDGLKEIEI